MGVRLDLTVDASTCLDGRCAAPLLLLPLLSDAAAAAPSLRPQPSTASCTMHCEPPLLPETDGGDGAAHAGADAIVTVADVGDGDAATSANMKADGSGCVRFEYSGRWPDGISAESKSRKRYFVVSARK
jgi:hypothetical protein